MLHSPAPGTGPRLLVRLVGLLLAIGAALVAHAISSDAAQAGASFHDIAPGVSGPATATHREPGIIGDDDRTQVTDTTAFPYSAVALLELYDADFALAGTCTGTFVGPDVVLTAAHCLWLNGDWTKHIRVVPGKNGADEPFGSVYATDWWLPTPYIDNGEPADFDWGLVRIPPGDITARTGWLPLAVLPDTSLTAQDFEPTIAGYPADRDGATMWQATVPAFDAVHERSLDYAIDTAGGDSGAAIWSANTGRADFAHVVGVHTRGVDAGGSNSGSRIDAIMLTDLLGGCAEIHCSIDVDQLAARGPYRVVGIGLAQD